MYNTLSFTPEDPKETKVQAKFQRKEKEYYYPGLNPVKTKKKGYPQTTQRPMITIPYDDGSCRGETNKSRVRRSTHGCWVTRKKPKQSHWSWVLQETFVWPRQDVHLDFPVWHIYYDSHLTFPNHKKKEKGWNLLFSSFCNLLLWIKRTFYSRRNKNNSPWIILLQLGDNVLWVFCPETTVGYQYWRWDAEL